MSRTARPKQASFTVYFGEELARYRTARGWSQDTYAEKVGWSVSLVRSIEQGRRKPPYGFGEKSDVLLGLDGRMTGLAKKAREEVTRFRDFVGLEARAASIRLFDPRVIPGLLQTPEYARALIEVINDEMSADDVETHVQQRMRRKEQLGVPIHAVIDEATLLRTIGGAAVMREQLGVLREPRRGVTLQVLRLSSGAHASVDGPLTLLRMSDEPDVAYADGWAQAELLDDPAEVLRAQRAFDRVIAVALSPEASRDLIRSHMEAL